MAPPSARDGRPRQHACDAHAAVAIEPDHRRPASRQAHDLLRLEQAFPRGRARRAAVAVARDPPSAPRSGEARDELGRRGHDLAVGDQQRTGCRCTCSSSRSRPGRRRSASSCVPSSRLMPAERARPNSRTTCSARHGGELVDHHQRRHRLGLQRGDGASCRSCTIAAAEHLREQRPAVGLEAEVDDRPRSRTRPSRSSCGAAACRGSSQRPTSDSARIASRSRTPARSRAGGRQRVEVGVGRPRASLSGSDADEHLELAPGRASSTMRRAGSPRRRAARSARTAWPR